MATTAPSMTAAGQRARYEEQGYLAFPDMLDRSEVAVAAWGIANAIANPTVKSAFELPTRIAASFLDPSRNVLAVVQPKG